MNSDILNETYVKICAEIDRLVAVKRAIEAARGAGGGETPVRTGSGHKTGKRAPRGTLEHAIVEVLKRKGGLVNGEIRERLEKAGYKYSLAPLHVGKTLTRMVKAKQIRLGHSGVRMEYSLP